MAPPSDSPLSFASATAASLGQKFVAVVASSSGDAPLRHCEKTTRTKQRNRLGLHRAASTPRDEDARGVAIERGDHRAAREIADDNHHWRDPAAADSRRVDHSQTRIAGRLSEPAIIDLGSGFNWRF